MRPQAQYEITTAGGDTYTYQLNERGEVINFRLKSDDGGEPKGSKHNPITGETSS